MVISTRLTSHFNQKRHVSNSVLYSLYPLEECKGLKMQETSYQGDTNSSRILHIYLHLVNKWSYQHLPCLRHEHVIVLHPVLQPQRTTLSNLGGAEACFIVTGIILPL